MSTSRDEGAYLRACEEMEQELITEPYETRIAELEAENEARKGRIAILAEHIANLEAEVAELEAGMRGLPTTADGVPVVPGMIVWCQKDKPVKGCVRCVSRDSALLDRDWAFANSLYSTREAAEGGRAHVVMRR